MSELINTNDSRATIRWKLLTGASALALTAYVSAAGAARAEDAGQPQIWIELGGDMQMMQGLSDPFTAPFMAKIANIGLDKGHSFIADQRPVRFALGLDGKITFQPTDSDWLFSASIRYGRAHSKRHVHDQGEGPHGYVKTVRGQHIHYYPTPYGGSKKQHFYGSSIEPFRDVDAPSSERHMLLDFSAGRDVGIGMFGHNGSSVVSAGVRIAQFREGGKTGVYVRPIEGLAYKLRAFPFVTFPYQYTMTAHAERSFKGVGPSLSWNASAGLAGNTQDGEITLDWGVTGAVLFGRQKAKTDHATQGYRRYHGPAPKYAIKTGPIYNLVPHHSTRSKNVTVPDFGAFAGLSYRYTDVKFSIGYRYDSFLKAMDAGIDTRDASNLTFNGPYASISIGLGD